MIYINSGVARMMAHKRKISGDALGEKSNGTFSIKIQKEGLIMKRTLTQPAVFVTLLFLILSFTLLQVGTARSEFPERQITLTMAGGVGGPVDLTIRVMAPTAAAVLGKPVVVDNKGGGGGTVALGIVATAKPDGYTLVASQNVAIIDAALMQEVTFKPLASFTPICAFGLGENTALLVKADAPWKTFTEFIDYAKKNPGKIKYSSFGAGSGMRVAMEVVAAQEGIKFVHVPFKGAPEARTALLGGHVDACSSTVDWPPFVKGGQLRVLVTHGRQRMAEFPDVPCLKELGYNFVGDAIHSRVGPAGIPSNVVGRLEAAFKKSMETPEFKSVTEKVYIAPYFLSSKEYEQHLKDRWPRMEKIFKDFTIIKEAATKPY